MSRVLLEIAGLVKPGLEDEEPIPIIPTPEHSPYPESWNSNEEDGESEEESDEEDSEDEEEEEKEENAEEAELEAPIVAPIVEQVIPVVVPVILPGAAPLEEQNAVPVLLIAIEVKLEVKDEEELDLLASDNTLKEAEERELAELEAEALASVQAVKDKYAKRKIDEAEVLSKKVKLENIELALHVKKEVVVDNRNLGYCEVLDDSDDDDVLIID